MEQRIRESENSYKFNISGKNGTYEVLFSVTAGGYSATCTCENSRSRKCWHKRYILSGRSSRIIGANSAVQQQLIHALKGIPGGNANFLNAKKRFPNETHCRRCNSENIVKIKKFYIARILMFFKGVRHTDFCKECKWTW